MNHRMKRLGDKLPRLKKKKIESDTSGPIDSGSTRMRLFKALIQNSDGLTVKEIKDLTNMDHKSGYLSNVLVDEISRGRIRKLIGYRRETAIQVFVYVLTPLGRQDFENKLVDGNRGAGYKIGVRLSRTQDIATSTSDATSSLSDISDTFQS